MDQNTNPEVGDSKVLPELPTQPVTPVQTLPEIKPTPIVETKLEPAGFKPKLPDNKNLGQMGKWLAVIILGLSLLFFIATSVFYALDNGGRIENVRITNVTANSATISWTTEDEVIGRVIWDDENNFMPFIFESIGKNVGYDDRDMVQVDLNQYELYLDGEKNGYTHHVTLRNLKPNTEYFFKVGSTKRYFSFEQTSFKTYAVAEDILAPEPFYGKVSSAEFDVFPPTDGIVYYRVDLKGDGTQYSNYHSTTIDPESGYSADMGYLLDSNGNPVRANSASRLELEVKTDRGDVKHSTKISDGVAPLMELEVIPTENTVSSVLKDVNALTKGGYTFEKKVPSTTGGNNSTTYKAKESNGNEKTVTKIKATKSSDDNKPREPQKPPGKSDENKESKSKGDYVKPIPPKNTNEPRKQKDTKVEEEVASDKKKQAFDKKRSTTSGKPFSRDTYEVDDGVAEDIIPAQETADLTQNREEGQRCSGQFSCGSGEGRCRSCNGESWCYGNKITCGNIEEAVRLNGGDVAYVEERLPELRDQAQDGDPTTSVYETFNVLLEVDNAFAPVRAWTQYYVDYSINQDLIPSATPSVGPSGVPEITNNPAYGVITSCGTTKSSGGKILQANKIRTNRATICDYGTEGTVTYGPNGTQGNCKVGPGAAGAGRCTTGVIEESTVVVPVSLDGLPTCSGDTSTTRSETHPDSCKSGTNARYYCNGSINSGGLCIKSPLINTCTCNKGDFCGGSDTVSSGSQMTYGGTEYICVAETSSVNGSTSCSWKSNGGSQRANDCPATTPVPTGVTCRCDDKCPGAGTVSAGTFRSTEGNAYECVSTFSEGMYQCSWQGRGASSKEDCSLDTPTPTPTVVNIVNCNQLENIILGSGSTTCRANNGEILNYCLDADQNGQCDTLSGSQPNGTVISEVLGASTTTATLTTGVYEITTGGGNSIELTIAEENATIKYFIDTNGDGIKQDSESEVEGQSLSITLNKVEEVIEYDLNNGWNLLGFEIISANWDTASELISLLNIQGISVTHVATYSEGKWTTFSMREDDEGIIQTFGQDFEIIPGQGYFIRSKVAGTMTLRGNAFTSSVPINMSNGWNLLSVQSPTSYNAQDFLNKCVSGGVQCDSLARFDSGLYEIVVSQGGTFFGNNFNLIKKSGYFVRVVGGGGKQITP